MPKGSDTSWVGKLMEKCSKFPHFDKPRFGTTGINFDLLKIIQFLRFFLVLLAFLVKHFSDTVQYESHGFLDKNRDTVSKELVNVLCESEKQFFRKIITMDEIEPEQKNTTGVKVVISAAKGPVNIQIL